MAEPEHGFGFVKLGQSLEHHFTVKNDGQGTLLLEGLTSSCSCTVGEISSRELAPQSTGTIAVRYRPNSLTGPDRQVVTIRTNDPEHAELALVVTSVVLPDIRFEPPQLDLTSGRAHVSTLRGTAIVRAKLHLAEVRGAKEDVNAVRVTVGSAPYDAKHPPELRAQLKPGRGASGAHRARVEAVVLTGLPDPSQLVVPIEWGPQEPPAPAQ